jgi:Fur family ferric uptake transcriptional regulator
MMVADEHIQTLREQGFRLTRQRRLILEAVRQHVHHLTAEIVYEAVRQQLPTIDLATVYRSLHWLHSMGLLRKFEVGGRLEFEYAGADAHHHLICNSCGQHQEIDNHVIEVLQAHILEHYGFEADPEHVALFGQCAECRAAEMKMRSR